MSAAPGRPQGTHGVDRQQADFDAIRARAACRGEDTNRFFPPRGARGSADARQICRRQCPVQQACLAYALKYDENYGVWGGLSETDRRVVKRQQRTYVQQLKAGEVAVNA